MSSVNVITPDPDGEAHGALMAQKLLPDSISYLLKLLTDQASEIEALKASIAGVMQLLSVQVNEAKEGQEVAAAYQQIQNVSNALQESANASDAATIASRNVMRSLKETIGAALGEDIEMVLVEGTASEDITAAELNAAAAGECTCEFAVRLQTASAVLHNWADFAPTVTPAESCTDVDIGAPTITQIGGGTAAFVTGILSVIVTFDTDAGATKTYQSGDSLTGTVDVTGLAICSGVSNFVKTYNVI